MTDKEIIQKLLFQGEKMRNCQKEYFKNRTKKDLVASKQAEWEFDNTVYNVKQLVK